MPACRPLRGVIPLATSHTVQHLYPTLRIWLQMEFTSNVYLPNWPTGPIWSSSRNVHVFIYISVPFSWNSPRGAKEVLGEQSCLPLWHQYPEKMCIQKCTSLQLAISPHPDPSRGVGECLAKKNIQFSSFLTPAKKKYWCYYLHQSKASVSPICRIF